MKGLSVFFLFFSSQKTSQRGEAHRALKRCWSINTKIKIYKIKFIYAFIHLRAHFLNDTFGLPFSVGQHTQNLKEEWSHSHGLTYSKSVHLRAGPDQSPPPTPWVTGGAICC